VYRYHLHDSLRLTKNLFVAEAHDAQPLRFEIRLSLSIVLSLTLMNWTVNFDYKAGLSAVKVDDVRPDHVLTAKPHSNRAVP
jgi:hypothetical protein